MRYVAVIAPAYSDEDGKIVYKDYKLRYFTSAEAMGSEMKRLTDLMAKDERKPVLYEDYFMLMSKKMIDDEQLDAAVESSKPDLGRLKLMIEVMDGSHPVNYMTDTPEVSPSVKASVDPKHHPDLIS